MADERHQKLAQVLVHYSLELKPGDRLLIQAPIAAFPLTREVFREAIRTGAYVVAVETLQPELIELLLREGSDEQLTYVSELDRLRVEQYTARLYVWGEENTRALSSVDPKRLALYQRARQALVSRRLEREANGEARWCGTLFPTHAYAQDAGMSLSSYEEFVFTAGMLDAPDPIGAWRRVYEEQQRIAAFLRQHDELHIVAPGTDLRLRVGGRQWINCAGKVNFPDGEVFTGPIEDSVSGTIRFSYPAFYQGHAVEGLSLTFEEGRVVKATARTNQAFLEAMLDVDPGARTVGEVAFGLNYNIQRFTCNTLFDEKIGGTMHLALGASLPESGGRNQSTIHWDMVNDLREGRVYADGQLCYENGRFLI
ncbi:MAG: aminopeptidase [Thermogemmatispora sp.]|uniref:Aminopeptidase n=1 Tax=Thermogemmatispora aurantia TaxID=2045279 RepID=A0A5J4KFX3_9CHLR|nr:MULTISPECIES: aminopeptidase [Thermogemmatispora]MBE3566513.1 aminopeptidase [Thermogemmatispora sp.]GER85211.1 aminopeptidase [Thermogemmatispora aurantia]